VIDFRYIKEKTRSSGFIVYNRPRSDAVWHRPISIYDLSMPFRDLQKKREYNRTPRRKLGFQRNRQKVKDRVFEAYGGYHCSCPGCSEDNPTFMTLDHVNDDGAEQRKSLQSSSALFYWIIRNDFPPGFQVLCWNCNCGRAMNNRVCPHHTFSIEQKMFVCQLPVFHCRLPI
jgi:hypothetical protein